MNKANLERLEMLLKGHGEMVEEKRVRPEGVLRHNDPFRERFNQASRSIIMPVLEEIKDVMVGKVESASIFHRSTTAGLKVKLDRWEDYDRSLLFYARRLLRCHRLRPVRALIPRSVRVKQWRQGRVSWTEANANATASSAAVTPLRESMSGLSGCSA